MVRETLAGFLDGDRLRATGLRRVQNDKIIHNWAGDRNGLGFSSALVGVSVAMAVSGREASRRERGNGVLELHCSGRAKLLIIMR